MKTKYTLIGLAVALAGLVGLAGCATPSAMRSSTAAIDMTSKRPAKDVAICVADRWENVGLLGTTTAVSMRPTRTGYTVAFRNEQTGHTQLLTDVDETAEGSRTRYFKNFVLGEGGFDKAVQECQAG